MGAVAAAMKRSPLRRTTRVRAVSTRMRATLPAKRAMRAGVSARAKGRCEVCGAAGPLEVHHVVKRSAGGQDTIQNGIALCIPCHARTDWPYAKGRLVFRVALHGLPLGQVKFAPDKWAARA